MTEIEQEETTLQRKIREKKEQQALEQALVEQKDVEKTEEYAQFSDLVPETTFERTDEDKDLDRFLEGISILDAYSKWSGRKPPLIRSGQRESIKIHCPWPEHKDDDPSASINLDKDVFMCHGVCNRGGDKYDIAAIRFSFPLDSYKSGANFHKLRRAMAESFGATFSRSGVTREVIPQLPESRNESSDPPADDYAAKSDSTGTVSVASPAAESLADKQLASISVIHEEEETDDSYFFEQSRLVNQDAFIKEGTFLDKWRKATSLDDSPDDFHFWHGILALSLAVGRDVRLADKWGIVYGNIFLCLLGPSGVGKSRSKRYLDQLWDSTNSRFNASDEPPKGIKLIDSPGSGEVLVKYFSHQWAPDPSNPKKLDFCSVRGLVDFNEFSNLHSIVTRRGATLDGSLMKLYDSASTMGSGSLTTGEKFAYQPYGCLLTTTQPRMLRKLITQSQIDSGFANRFIFATGIPKEENEFFGEMADITPALSPYSAIRLWSQMRTEGITVVLSEESKELAADFWKKKVLPAENADESGLFKRIRLTLKKIILLNAINEKQEIVTPEMLIRSLSIFDYFVRAYSISGNRIAETHHQEIERAIFEAIKLQEKQFPGKGISANEIRNKFKRQKFELVEVAKILETLVKLGELDKLEQQRGPGRPTLRYKVAE